MFDINKITRNSVKELQGYSSARDEFKGEASIWLDANENPNNTYLNRYPDPLQLELKEEIAAFRKVKIDQIFMGNGSDEAIDLLFRAFCEPRQSKVVIFPPTYGMYEVSAALNEVELITVPLTSEFEIPPLNTFIDELNSSRLLFICSPNNPTGNAVNLDRVKELTTEFCGLVVVDEAYIDFSNKESATSLISEIPNLVVLQTLSKAFGLAGARIGMAFGNSKIISVMNKIKPPYNVNTLSINAGLKVLVDHERIGLQITETIKERELLRHRLKALDEVIKIYPSDANFLLVQFSDAEKVFRALLKYGIVVRNRTSQIQNCLRITVGTPAENNQLLRVLKEIL